MSISVLLVLIHLIHQPLEGVFPQFFLTQVYYTNISSLIGLVLAPLLHASISHLVQNLVAFVISGVVIETVWDRTEYIVLLCATGLSSILGQTIWYELIGKSTYVLGFSGVVFGCYGYLIWRSDYSNLLRGSLTGGLLLIILYSTVTSASVANISHLIGLVVGGLIGGVFSSLEVDTQTIPILSKYRK